jgi:hypothetical protein
LLHTALGKIVADLGENELGEPSHAVIISDSPVARLDIDQGILLKIQISQLLL